jgi:8-oxo-dGTP pyrophosphatase MutT (NUDIX family)
MVRQIQRFEVSLKAFIVRNGRALFVRESDTGYWELPGGRIDVGEEFEPHALILARELSEELGPALAIEVGESAVTWTRRRPSDGIYQFIVARLCRLSAGEPMISDEHSELLWLDQAGGRGLGYPPESGYVDAVAALWRLAARN